MRLLLALILSLVVASFATEAKGFSGVPFGAEKEAVIEEMLKQGYAPETQPGGVLVPVYRLGDLLVEVIFRFNQAGHFFSYEMRTGTVEVDRFAKVVEAVRYMSEQLVQSFGPPARKNFYRLEEIQGKKAAPYWVWEDPEVDVATFIKPRDARFYTQATVTQKQLARERAP